MELTHRGRRRPGGSPQKRRRDRRCPTVPAPSVPDSVPDSTTGRKITRPTVLLIVVVASAVGALRRHDLRQPSVGGLRSEVLRPLDAGEGEGGSRRRAVMRR